MITVEKNPFEQKTKHTGTLELDRTYTFVVEKTIYPTSDGPVKTEYEVEKIEYIDEFDGPTEMQYKDAQKGLYDAICGAVVNHLKKTGL